MPILAPDHLNAISPPRALSCPQSPQSPAPTLTLRHQTPIALQNRFESARSKKFVLGMPIPLPSLSEQNGQDVDMVETSNEVSGIFIDNCTFRYLYLLNALLILVQTEQKLKLLQLKPRICEFRIKPRERENGGLQRRHLWLLWNAQDKRE